MKIVMIGAGNVAAVLGRKFKAAGHTLLQVISRNSNAASALAYEWDTESTNYISLINRHADIYIIAVSDEAIGEVIKDLYLPGKVVAHTAAAVKMEILRPVTEDYGVFYPLQSLRKEMKTIPEIPVFIDAGTQRARQMLEKLAGSVSSEPVSFHSGDERLKFHIAAVVVSNFTNYLYALAEDYCKKEKIDFRLLLPLIKESATRLQEASPSSVQTGPAARNDQTTLQKHLLALEAYPELQKVYAFLSDSIREKH
ncbi:MAG: DUF2520 domain-containing protein [Terrimonas sp.]|nr:DUF2520 domain-containing protein [Terrimonas sp.]